MAQCLFIISLFSDAAASSEMTTFGVIKWIYRGSSLSREGSGRVGFDKPMHVAKFLATTTFRQAPVLRNVLSEGYRRQILCNVKMSIHLHFAPELRIRGVYPHDHIQHHFLVFKHAVSTTVNFSLWRLKRIYILHKHASGTSYKTQHASIRNSTELVLARELGRFHPSYRSWRPLGWVEV